MRARRAQWVAWPGGRRVSVLRATLLGVVLAGSAGGCGPDATAPLRLQGTFTLRAVQTSTLPYAAVALPVSFAGSAPGDSTRWLGGTFTLSADGTWQERVTQELVFGGGAPQARVLGGGDHYRAHVDDRGRYVLELYPDRALPAVVLTVALLASDTLYHSLWIFVR